MPIDLDTPITVTPPIQADRFLVCGFQVREADYNTGIAHPFPSITIYWVKLDKATGAVRDRGVYTLSTAAFAGEKPNGALSYRANIRDRLYKVLQDAGVFPEGIVS